MRADWTVLAGDGDMRAHVSLPSTRSAIGAGVVILHGGWGVEPGLLSLPKRFAHAGYAAIVPDLFHRESTEQTSRVPLERIADLTWTGARADVEAATAHLRAVAAVDRLAILGFCMGGALAWMCGSALGFQAVTLFYPHEMFRPFGADGVVPFDLAPNPTSPILGHFGADDKNPSPADAQRLDEALTAQHVPHQFYSYEGAGHGFAIKAEGRPSYRPIAAHTSIDRTIGWFDRYLRNIPLHR